MGKFIDIKGQRYGRLVAMKPAGKNVRGRTLWLCQCDCSYICIVCSHELRSNDTRSCGCLKKEQPGGAPKHGHARVGKYHPLYRTWCSMRERCNNPHNKQYKYYGGRGIEVCERWDDFSVYLNDILTRIGPRPPGMVIDRIDNDGNYSPDNVKWSTRSQSNRNKRYPKPSSGFKGVQQYGRRWRAIIRYNGKRRYIKTFDTPEEASRAYQYVAKRLHAFTMEKNAGHQP